MWAYQGSQVLLNTMAVRFVTVLDYLQGCKRTTLKLLLAVPGTLRSVSLQTDRLSL